MPHQTIRQAHQSLRDPAGLHQLAGKNKKRDRQQYRRIDAVKNSLRDDHEKVVGPDHSDQRSDAHGKGDGHTQGDEDKEAKDDCR